MPVDSMKVSYLYREMRKAVNHTKIYQPSIPYTVNANETLDSSLTNRLVYGNREDWLVSAAACGFNDVDLPVRTGQRLFLTPDRVYSLANGKKKSSFDLY